MLAAWVVLSLTMHAQRYISEATLRYTINIQSEADSLYKDLLKGAVHTCYVKGPSSRLDLETSLGKQSTIFQGKTGHAVLLKEYGMQHYMIQLTPRQWEEVNMNYEDSKLELLGDTMSILGYPCQKANVSLKDGTSFQVWYTTSLIPAYKEFQQMGKNLPGLLMEYEAIWGGVRVRYRISQLNFNPVPQALFDIPTTGYRVLTYEESKRLGGN